MSLEESIKTLNESINQLTTAITLLNYNSAPKPELSQVEQSLKATAQPSTKETKKNTEQTKETPTSIPTCEPLTVADLKKEVNDPAHLRVELQEICSAKIVKDRTLKPHIVKIISEYNGATHLAKVADVHLEELKERLSAL
jgi:exonuclease VII small subunit